MNKLFSEQKVPVEFEVEVTKNNTVTKSFLVISLTKDEDLEKVVTREFADADKVVFKLKVIQL